MRDNIAMIGGIALTVIAFIGLLIHVSLHREIILSTMMKMIKVMCLIALLPLAYFTYPEGIMNISLAQVTVGEIGRLSISVIFILIFIAFVVFLIRRNYDY